MPYLNKDAPSSTVDAKTEGIGGEDEKRLDKDDDEKSTWENIV